MKAVEIVKPGELRVFETPMPVLNEKNNVLIKMTAAGICGSDVGIYHGTNAAAVYPRIIGHEMVGVVQKIYGQAAGQSGGYDAGKTAAQTAGQTARVKIGDRVIVNQVTSCGHCYPCSKGRGNVCDNLAVRGVHIDGGYKEYLAVPESDCYVLPDSSILSDSDAVMIEPTTIALQACSRAQLEQDDVLLIYGYGALGSSLLKIARLTCRTIIIADVVDEKLAEARKNGALYTINISTENFADRIKEYSGGRGVTAAVDAVCYGDSLVNCLRAAGNAGRVITMGFSTQPTEINQFLITSKELDVRGSRLQNNMFGKAVELINQEKLDLSGSVSHTFAFTDAQKAFDFIDSKDPSIRKIVLTFDE